MSLSRCPRSSREISRHSTQRLPPRTLIRRSRSLLPSRSVPCHAMIRVNRSGLCGDTLRDPRRFSSRLHIKSGRPPRGGPGHSRLRILTGAGVSVDASMGWRNQTHSSRHVSIGSARRLRRRSAQNTQICAPLSATPGGTDLRQIGGSGAPALSEPVTFRYKERPPELQLRAFRRAVQAAGPVTMNDTMSS